MSISINILASGSRGNSSHVSAHGRSLIIDAGLSARETLRRMELVSADPETVEGIVITHEHSDHVKGARALARRLKIPVYATQGTFRKVGLSDDITTFVIEPGKEVSIGSFKIIPFTIPHDAEDPVGLLIDAHGASIGIATDLGFCTQLVRKRLANCSALVVEFNHDDKMLMEGPYPWFLKQRVRGRMGHLSNDSSGDMLKDLIHSNLQHVVLAHLSEVNNLPELAEGSASEALGSRGNGICLHVASAADPIPTIYLDL